MPANSKGKDSNKLAEPIMPSVDELTGRCIQYFEMKEDVAKKWVKGDITLEKALNLVPSEDAVITNFILPLLKNILGYNTSDIDVKPQFTLNEGSYLRTYGGQGDILVKKNGKPVLVIEAKSYGEILQSNQQNAEGQAFDYTRANELKPRPKYYMTSNVEETHIYETLTRLELDISPIYEKDILSKVRELKEILAKLNILPLGKSIQTYLRAPIEDQRQFERLLYNCQDDMREASESKTGITAFAEMNKLLFIKIFEDRRERKGQENRFTIRKIEQEGENYISGSLFRNIKRIYKDQGIRIFRDEDEINLEDTVINRIVERLERVLLVDEENNVYPPIAHVYENFVSTIFRGENGQYFTPRKIVDFMIKMSNIKYGEGGKRVVDPACGSGGFLLGAFAIMSNELKSKFYINNLDGTIKPRSDYSKRMYDEARKNLCSNLLVGVDNEEIVAKTAAMNMSVHGDGSTGIHFGDSLLIDKFRSELKAQSFDYVLTNPPFSSVVKKKTHIDSDGSDVLSHYELSHMHEYIENEGIFKWSKSEETITQQDSKVLFIERCYELLNENGLLGIIVDDGVLNNPTADYVRDYIMRNFLIKAIIALPYDSFKFQDAHNYTSILFLKKKKAGEIQSDIFMAVAEHIGENFGKSTVVMPNDLEKIVEDYVKFNEGNEKQMTALSFVCKASKIENFFDKPNRQFRNRLDPKFYHPKKEEIEAMIKKTGISKPLSEVVDFVSEKCPRNKVNSFGSLYIEKITKEGILEYDSFSGNDDPRGAKDRIFRAGDLVVSRINLKSGMICIIPEEIKEIMGTSEYYSLVPKSDKDGKPTATKAYLRIILTQESIQYLMHARSTGQYGRLNSETELPKLEIPVPNLKEQEEIVKKYNEEQTRIQMQMDEVNKIKAEVEKSLTNKIFSMAHN
jgi:type I restriction enzyme M protein